MSAKERERKSVFELVKEGVLNLKEAARRLRLSYRQTCRSYGRYRREGDAGLVHGKRGKPSNRGKPAGFRRDVLRRYRERYEGFGPTLAAEKMAQDGYAVDHETLRRWLIEGGQWSKRRKRGKHRSRRERKEHFGELVQLDGSHHGWFGPHKPRACLMNMVDDACGTTQALMAEQETTEVAMRLLWQWIEKYGIPLALYADKKNVFVTKREPTLQEQLLGQEPLTTFGKACKKLGIEIITAHSPQAKGRVERSHGIYQDRFVKELKLRGITTIEGANELLRGGFCAHLNARFERQARAGEDFHRPLPVGMNLDEVFCLEEERQVNNDWTVRYKNQFLQIIGDNRPLPKAKEKVLVRELLDGRLQIVYRGKPLAFTPIAVPPTRPAQQQIDHYVTHKPKPKWKPAPDHPWRRGLPLSKQQAHTPP